LWSAIDSKGEVLESFVTKTRDNKVTLKSLKKSLKRHGHAEEMVTDRNQSRGAAPKNLCARDRQET
jgi:putative transposase